MADTIKLDAVYKKSEEVVSREIRGALVIVPMATGVGDMEDALYTLNETGREIWDRLDGSCSLEELVVRLAGEYDAGRELIREEVVALMEELVKRRMVKEVDRI